MIKIKEDLEKSLTKNGNARESKKNRLQIIKIKEN